MGRRRFVFPRLAHQPLDVFQTLDQCRDLKLQSLNAALLLDHHIVESLQSVILESLAAFQVIHARVQLHLGLPGKTEAVGGSRLFPQTATGFQLQSSELEGLDLEAGHFTEGKQGTTTKSRGELYATYAGETAKSADFIGGRYAITDNLSASLYGAELEDIYRQYYLNSNYTIPLASDQSLGFDFNIYRTNDEGKAKAGDISNTTWSLAAAYTLDAHTFTLAYQKVHGDQPFDYIGFGENGSGGGGDSIFLANSVQYSDFNGPGEKSWQARYDLNLASYGVPGLTFMVRYINGKDIDGTKMSDNNVGYKNYGYGEDGKHHETNLEAKYVVQSGPAKDLSFRIRQAWHRANADQAEGDQNEFRLIVDYPLSIL